MAFEFFTEQDGTCIAEPLVTVFKKRIYFNRFAQKKHSLNNHKYVLLGFDKDKQQICVKFINSTQLGSRRIRDGGVSCKYFLDYFQIPRRQKGLEVFDVEGNLIIQLKVSQS